MYSLKVSDYKAAYKNNTCKVVISFRAEEDVKARFFDFCEYNNLSASAYLSALLENAMDNEDSEYADNFWDKQNG